MAVIEVWTDGSGLARRDGEVMLPIGYAFVCRIGDHIVEMAVYDPAGTSSTAELKAAIAALRALNPQACLSQRLVIRSDSTYVIGAAQRQYKVNANHDLVWELQKLSEENRANWEHCPGHSGDWGNERCDKLAGWARTAGSGPLVKIMRFAWFNLKDPENPYIQKYTKESVTLWDGNEQILIRSLV